MINLSGLNSKEIFDLEIERVRILFYDKLYKYLGGDNFYIYLDFIRI